MQNKFILVSVLISIFGVLLLVAQDSKDKKKERGYLGIVTRELDARTKNELGYRGDTGLVVTKVLPNSPARTEDIFADDIIKEFNGKVLKTHEQLRWMALKTKPGTKIKLKVWRGGKERQIEIEIAKYPKKDYGLEYSEEEKKQILERGI
jgi:serine protease Do